MNGNQETFIVKGKETILRKNSATFVKGIKRLLVAHDTSI